MPGTTDPQQTGIIAAVTGAVVVLIGKMVDWGTSLRTQKTTLDVKVIDSQDAYTNNLRSDVEKLTTRIENMQTQVNSLKEESLTRQLRIGELELQVKEMTYQIGRLQDEKKQKQQEYEEDIDRLQSELVDKENQIKALRQQIADMEVIGVGEKSPPSRRKDSEA